MRLLDLFCGAGGAAVGYHRAGFEVVGVDNRPQKHFPFEFHLADAFDYLRDHGCEFDVIHASPPCQAYCALNTMTNRRQHPKLIEELRGLLPTLRLPFVVENVFGAPLDDPILLCGSFFGLGSGDYGLKRHRYFETNIPILNGFHCQHLAKTLGVYGAKVRDIAREKRHYAKDKETRGNPLGVVLPKHMAFEAMGINWMSMAELSEAIPPAYTEWIGKQLMKVVK